MSPSTVPVGSAAAARPGIAALRHIVVLMMENRSFDHMLGALKTKNPAIDGLDGKESNRDTTGAEARVRPLAEFQSQLDPDPDHSFKGVDVQLFNGDTSPARRVTMQGFVRSYYEQQRNVKHSRQIMYYFPPEKLPVLTTLATQFAVFNGWFSSIPGPTLCNRAFAHYGTSFGNVAMEFSYTDVKYTSIYKRMLDQKRTAKLYFFDEPSSSLEVANILKDQGPVFGTVDQFLQDCRAGTLPDYSFLEPNYTDHDGPAGQLVACDQHPDHDVRAGERFIATIYNAVKASPLWPSTALLVVYDEHGGIYDHVVPPTCLPDEFTASPDETGTGAPFHFDRLGVRVPAILISPWVTKGTVIPSTRVFDHASIPATVTEHFIGSYPNRSPREANAGTFLEWLSEPAPRPNSDTPVFKLKGA
jgi:phospholipase C